MVFFPVVSGLRIAALVKCLNRLAQSFLAWSFWTGLAKSWNSLACLLKFQSLWLLFATHRSKAVSGTSACCCHSAVSHKAGADQTLSFSVVSATNFLSLSQVSKALPPPNDYVHRRRLKARLVAWGGERHLQPRTCLLHLRHIFEGV